MYRALVVALFVTVFAATTVAEAQMRPPVPPQRPPWKDVCCGGPCCVKPRLPGR